MKSWQLIHKDPNQKVSTVCFASGFALLITELILLFVLKSVVSGTANAIVFACISVLFYFGAYLMKDEPNCKKYKKFAFYLIFGCYLFLLIYLTNVSPYYERSLNFVPKLQPIPFKTIFYMFSGMFKGEISFLVFFENILGNLVVFAPLAILLPINFESLKLKKPLLITTLFIILIIEFSQLILGNGAADIDDVILNFAGVCLLFTILENKRLKKLLNSFLLLKEGQAND